MKTTFPRPLRDEGRRLVRWMIEHGNVDPQQHLAQLDAATVIDQCKCGCASIDFAINGTRPDIKKGMYVISDWLYGPDSPPFGAFIFTCGDILAGLEVYSFTDQPAPLPTPEDLRPFEQTKTEPGS